MKKMLMLLLVIFAGVAMADATFCIKNVKAQQRYPWNGLVDIVVTIQGDVSRIANYGCTFAATNSANLETMSVASIRQVGLDTVSGDVCTRRYLWNATNDVGLVKIDDLALTVDVKELGGVQLWENGPYWAECNVGASKPEECGYYFWWGDTVGYKRNAANNGWVSVKDGTEYGFYESQTCNKDNAKLQSQGYIDSTGNLVAAHDAATVHLGAPWRMPTNAEMDELISNCDAISTTRNGVSGTLVTGRGSFASKSIFLPYVGCGYASGIQYAEVLGCYWSSTPNSESADSAWYLLLGVGYFNLDSFFRGYRGYAHPVRPLRWFVK